MNVKVRLFGTLNRFSDPDTPGFRKMDVPGGCSAADLIKMLKAKDKEVVAAVINGKTCPFDRKLQKGDEVYLLTALGGG